MDQKSKLYHLSTQKQNGESFLLNFMELFILLLSTIYTIIYFIWSSEYSNLNPSCADGDYSLSLVPANRTALFMLQQISYTGDFSTHPTSRLCVTLEQSKSLSVATTAIKLVGLTAKCYLI